MDWFMFRSIVTTLIAWTCYAVVYGILLYYFGKFVWDIIKTSHPFRAPEE